MKFRRLSPAALALMAVAAALPVPATAQFSKSYKFLDAVRSKDGQTVTDDLAEPGTTIVNTHDSTSGQTALHIVTARRDATWMTFLLAKGADPNARDVHGATPLVVAASLGFVEGVKLLIDHGARVDEPNSTGETPLIAAVHVRDVEMIRALLAGGANPDRADNSGRSARDYAALEGKGGALSAVIDSAAKTHDAKAGGTYGPSL